MAHNFLLIDDAGEGREKKGRKEEKEDKVCGKDITAGHGVVHLLRFYL